MSCIQVRTLLDNPSTTPGEMAPIFNYIQGRLLADDDSWVADGHDPVAQKWDEKGVRNSIATVTATCASNRDDTIDQRTDAVFEGFAQLAVMLGVAK